MKYDKKVMGLLLVVSVLTASFSFILVTPNLGFEGGKCLFYGAYVNGGKFSGFDGSNEFHAYHDAEPYLATKTVYDSVFGPRTDSLYWASVATPNQPELGFQVAGHRTKEYPHLQVHIESSVQLQHITRQGDPDPLDWNIDNPLEGRRIEYWSKQGTKVTETNDTIRYEYELTKESFLIVPAEFWIGFSLVPAQEEALTASGWREGEYSDLTAWFMLDFHTWDNAYYDDWLRDPQEEVFTTEFGGTIVSQEKLADPAWFRGGWPIAGWIQGWEKAGWTSDSGEAQSPLWFDTRSADSKTYTEEQLRVFDELHEILEAKTRFAPGMVGSHLMLYDGPSAQFSYEPEYSAFDDTDGLTRSVRSPDSAMRKVMYFPINILNFGTYAQDLGWWGTTGWKVYYPSAYFRIRLIYGVYGSFKYLWTEEVAKNVTEGGVNYPTIFERTGTTVITTRGAMSPFADLGGGIVAFFSDPMGQAWAIFILLVIGLLLATAFNPGMWTALAEAWSRTRKGRKEFK